MSLWTMLWKNKGIDFSLPDDVCAISLDAYDISGGICRCNKCCAVFNYDALKPWLDMSIVCPNAVQYGLIITSTLNVMQCNLMQYRN